MKVVILAGGYGTRISEETQTKPKPMVEIGGKPILWHIMKIYSSYGFNEFIICLGYKAHVIKDYFASYLLHRADVTFEYTESKSQMTIHQADVESWKVTLVDTGDHSMTGGRIGRIKPFVQNEPFLATYGDGVSDVNIPELVKHHKKHQKLATLTAVQPSGRFGALDITKDQKVDHFIEKPTGDGSWVNGGFFVLEPKVFDYIEDDESVFETDVLPVLSQQGELLAYKHTGFWKPMDTLNDRNQLEKIWNSGNAPWKKW
ncbi:glucose-1-phosphate cytidylyltransferase [Bacillus alkalicellulosilyticus]|uniref:glucose-1-phosphate cytidylyltransferase n=1 Tax=Alkalihalobacterium alkalicellulosilyticum TaxID=1912214 RepID=UPI000998D727|nr:glucose-1-phosphate cytidylyltransferase [Bacillus alkalicellulosilyticus]